MTARVWAIPLAAHGFVSVHETANPVRWHLEDYDTGKLIAPWGEGFATKAEAEAAARARGYDVQT